MRRSRKAPAKAKAKAAIEATEEARETDDRDSEDEEVKGGFFGCYLLSSRSPRHKGHTYIGFTVNPRRRIKQHNGELRSGAWRTKHGRPWEMVLCIYGFPSNVSALQFEWAWQHPTESLAVRKAASSFKSFSGVENKMKLAYTMLSLPSWENLDLTVNFFSTKFMKHTAVCPRLPKQMRVNVCAMDDLPCYTEGEILNEYCYDDYENTDEEGNNKNVNEPTVSDTFVNGMEGCNRESPIHGAEHNEMLFRNTTSMVDSLSSDPIQENSFHCHSPTPVDAYNGMQSSMGDTSAIDPIQENSFHWQSPVHGNAYDGQHSSVVGTSAHDPIQQSPYRWESPCDRLDWNTYENFRDRTDSEECCFTESSKPSEEKKEVPTIENLSLAEDDLQIGRTPCKDDEFQRNNLDDSGKPSFFKSWRRIKPVNRRNDCSKASKSNKQLHEGGDLLKQRTDRSSNNEASFDNAIHERSDVIDLTTPYNCKIQPRKRAASEIIDLTDSPDIFQL